LPRRPVLRLALSPTSELSFRAPAMALSRAQVRNAFTAFGVTRDFLHMQPIPRWWTQRMGWFDSKIHVVKPKDRIKYWNIVPGDQVRLRGDPEGRIYEVNMINRLSNRVLLKTEQDNVSLVYSMRSAWWEVYTT